MPSIKNYKINEDRINELQVKIDSLEEDAKSFQEYKKLKEKMEMIERNRRVNRNSAPIQNTLDYI